MSSRAASHDKLSLQSLPPKQALMPHSKPIPQAKGHFLLGNIRPMQANAFQAMRTWQRDYGDLVSFRLATRGFYLFSHPGLVEQALIKHPDVFVKIYDPKKPSGLSLVLGQGLVTSRGELWQTQRRLMQPVFQRKNLAALEAQMLQAGQSLLSRWRELGAGTEVNLSKEMLRLTLEVITQTMFSTSVLDKIDQIAPALDTALKFAARNMMNPLLPPLFIPTAANRKFNQAIAVLDSVIYGIIEQRRSISSSHNDLLDMLLNAKDDSGNSMSDQQIRDEVLTIFSAGHETTSNLLSWTLYLLARHPEILAKLRQELDSVLQGRTPDAEAVQQLVYTKAVLNESLRLRPPAAVMMRRISKDIELEGYSLKAGRIAIFNLYNVHHHPDFWTQPEQFDPERFLKNVSYRFAHMPFGGGERICIGSHFAMLESQLLLSMIVQRFDVQLPNDNEVEIEMAVALRPKGGIPARIYPRQV